MLWIVFAPAVSPMFVGFLQATNGFQQQQLFITVNNLFNCTKENGTEGNFIQRAVETAGMNVRSS